MVGKEAEMKCRFCGGREFRLIVRYVVSRTYNEEDTIASGGDIDDGAGDEEDSHYCTTCEKDIKDKDLISDLKSKVDLFAEGYYKKGKKKK